MLYVGNQKCFPIISSTRAEFLTNQLYDAELEYLENTAASYIDTGFKPNQNTRIVAEMQVVRLNSYGRLFGSGMYNAKNGYMIDYEGGKFCVKWGHTTSWTTTTYTDYANKHIYDYNRNEVYIDNELIISTASTAFQCTSNLAIFTYINGTATGTNTENCWGRCYSFKIYDNDVLVLDLIPVRINQEGCMYDKLSKKLFRNAGTGQFVLGPDKQEE